MFPITDSSQTVIDALLHAAVVNNNVRIQLRTKISQIIPPSDSGGKFQLIYTSTGTTGSSTPTSDHCNKKTLQEFDAVIVATGSAPAGYALVAASSKNTSTSTETTGSDANSNNTMSEVVGQPRNNVVTINTTTIHHPFVSSVPSLFTFNCKHAVNSANDGLLVGLAGVSVPKVRVSFAPAEMSKLLDSETKKRGSSKKIPAHLMQEGPILITHHGLSGPAILRLSAFGARDMAMCQYRGIVTINWIPDLFQDQEECFNTLWATTSTNPKKSIASQCPILLPSTPEISAATTAIPKRLWQSLVRTCDIPDSLCWGSVNKQLIRKLSEQLMTCRVEVTSKSTNKDEFVTACGVVLSSINMKTMQSKNIPGLFFCGELLNVDGVTGGFNFYNCWSTGYVAGTSAATYTSTQQQVKRE